MLLVLDVSLNELECKHALNNSAKTRLIIWCLHLSAETPDLMLYRWIRCSDLIIYITFLYMKETETLGQIHYSVSIPPSNAGTRRKQPGWRCQQSIPAAAKPRGVHLRTPFIEHVFVERGCARTCIFQLAANPFINNGSLQSVGESTRCVLFQKDC